MLRSHLLEYPTRTRRIESRGYPVLLLQIYINGGLRSKHL
jgi:hypothetical protein